MPDTKDLILTKEKTADLLKVSLATLHRIVARGDLAIVKVGKSVKFKAADVANYINRSTVQKSSATA